jgi:hypothetical protein
MTGKNLNPRTPPLSFMIVDCLPPLIVSERRLYYVDGFTLDLFEIGGKGARLSRRKAGPKTASRIIKKGWSPLRSWSPCPGENQFFALVGSPDPATGEIREGDAEEFKPGRWGWVPTPAALLNVLGGFDALCAVSVKETEGEVRIIRQVRPSVSGTREDVTESIRGGDGGTP